ncbi:hypothetical protein EIN_169390 [Entamoeba invadens IP1]|uniref:Uncharacterized protein n=1 Tax=Entamoeba invadens IP1 TaxID=370355 RepID=A0A0A1TVL5_ENTIV|nr:hypothetical protein EIN_169390 [Entamoeba invadens IP1]ELP84504.1 hypothetical protein EIN_169390 [Entamoeba invadens IP1]|eukprot:XP_004183850.1 hypothetical protein EIN_169390 [Entamoeba invadens IP1]
MTNTKEFNTILFDNNSHLLYAIFSNLIYDPDDTYCLDNANLLISHFQTFNKIENLFMWTYQNQNNTCLLSYLSSYKYHYFYDRKTHTKHSTIAQINSNEFFFSTLNTSYFAKLCFPIIKDTIKSLLQKGRLMELDASILSINPSYLDELSAKSFQTTVEILTEDVKVVMDSIRSNIKQFPDEYVGSLKKIKKANCKEKNDFFITRLILDGFARCLKNKEILRSFMTNQQTAKECDGIELLGRTLFYLNKGEDLLFLKEVEKRLGTVVGVDDVLDKTDFSEILQIFKNERERDRESGMGSNLTFLLRCHFITLKKCLSPEVKERVLTSLGDLTFASADESSLQFLFRKLEKVFGDYVSFFEKVNEEKIGKVAEYRNQQDKIEVFKTLYANKKETNRQLAERLNALRQEKGMKSTNVTIPEQKKIMVEKKLNMNINLTINPPKNISVKINDTEPFTDRPDIHKKKRKASFAERPFGVPKEDKNTDLEIALKKDRKRRLSLVDLFTKRQSRDDLDKCLKEEGKKEKKEKEEKNQSQDDKKKKKK